VDRLRWIVVFLLVIGISGCNLSNVPPTPTPEPDIPEILFLFPANGTVVVIGTDVQIQLYAQDRRGVGVGRVELYVDEALLQTSTPVISAAVTEFTVDMNWLAEGVGRHTFRAVAYRPDGTESQAAFVTLEVISPSGDATLTATP
jgi:hypothetical protein